MTTTELNDDTTDTRFEDAQFARQEFGNLGSLITAISRIGKSPGLNLSDEAHEITGLCDVASQVASTGYCYFQGIVDREIAAEAKAMKAA